MADFDRRPESTSHQTHQTSKKPNFGAYKLLIDPVLTKGGFKVYRFDGYVPDDPLYPPVSVRDPRNPNMKARIWNRIEPLKLPMPKFKIDANYIGIPPRLEVTIKNINDNINKQFLRDVLCKYGDVEELFIYYHPVTKKHLGLARVIFFTTVAAKACVDKLNKTSMMGQIIEVFYDPFGQKCKLLYEDFLKVEKNVEIWKREKRLVPNENERNNKIPHHVNSSVPKGNPLMKRHRTSIAPPRNDYTPSSDLGYGTTSERSSTYSEGSHTSMVSHYGSYQHDLYDTHSGKHPDTYLSNPYMNSYQIAKEQNEPVRIHKEYVAPKPRPKTPTSDGDSPKMDLDTRIKLLLKSRKETQFGNIIRTQFELTSSDSESENETVQHPRKRPILSISKREIWDSGSEEENVEAAFAKKFKKNTFVPVDEENSKLDKKHMSPPPSPFLSLSNSSRNQKQSNKLTGFDNELDQISDDSEGLSPKNKKHEDDDMSLSSLSPDDPSLIQLPPQPPQLPSTAVPPPLPAYPPPETYFPNYGCMPHNQLPYGHYMYPHWNPPQNTQPIPFPPQPPPIESLPESDKPPPPPEPPSPEHDTNTMNEFVNTTISIMLDRLVNELKHILKRDFEKRMIEQVAYHKFDIWIDEHEQSYKKRQENRKNNANKLNEPVQEERLTEATVNRERVGFMSSIPKLPSFRKIAPAPVKREVLSAKSESDTDFDSESEKEVKPTRKRKRRRLTSLSSGSISSAWSDSSNSDNESVPGSVVSATDLISDGEIMFSEPDEAKAKTNVLLSGAENISDDSSEEQVIPKAKSVTPEKEIKVKEEEVTEEPNITESTIEPLVFVENPIDLFDLDADVLSGSSSPTAHLVDHNYCIQIPGLPTTPPLLDSPKESPIVDIKPPESVHVPYGSSKGKKRKKSFKRRSKAGEVDALFQFLTQGVDEEDLNYLKMAYQAMLTDDHSQSYWLNATHWVDYPATYNPRLKPNTSGRVHLTGSARSEGFYRLTTEEKTKHKRQWGIQSSANNIQSLALAPVGVAHERPQGKQALSREARSNQRRLLTALGNEVDSDLLKFNQLKFRKKSLRFARSRIHDWGLFASEAIAADEMVIEYVGQKIRPLVADVRERKYEAVGIGSSYLFRIDLENVIDATKGGNVSRFINHSCNPNCYAKIITIEGQKKIVIYSKQPIAVNEEITYDYKFPIEDDKIPCLCGSAQCRGTLN